MIDNHAHRVAVVGQLSGAARIQGIVTQTDLLAIVRDNLATLGHLARAQIGTLFALDHNPVTMLSSSTQRQCFQQLTAHGYNGCALVDSDGVIVGNVSVSDVRALSDVVLAGGDVDTVLDSPVMSFLKGSGDAPRAPVTVTAADTLSSLIELMGVSHVHRVHVVDRHRHAVGVVTTMDVIRVLLSSELTLHDNGVAAAAADTGAAAGDSKADATPSPSTAPTDSGSETKTVELDHEARAEAVSCPLVSATFRAMTALDFVKTDGVVIEDLVEIAAEAPIGDAMRVMAEHHLSSLPVTRNEVVSWTGAAVPFDFDYVSMPVTEKKYAGWLDASDLAAVVLSRSVSAQKQAGIVSAVTAALTFDEEHATVASMNFSHSNPFWAVPVERRMDKVRVLHSLRGTRAPLVHHSITQYAEHRCMHSTRVRWRITQSLAHRA